MKMEGILSEDIVKMVAHDLTNPLTCILGYAELLIANHVSEEIKRKMMQNIRLCGQQAVTMINDLQDASALELGKLPLRLETAELNEVVKRTVDVCEVLCREKGIGLSFIGNAPSLRLPMDVKRIAQVIQNFLSNAIKHSPPSAGRITVSIFERSREALVAVSDNGEGIEPSEQSDIFEKFFQVRPQGGRGLGLGLHISKVIVEAHHGRIGVFSGGEGTGSTFYFGLPKS